jgi:predicted nucleic acid-binding protein
LGNGTVNAAVSDAGPLIHLREISCLSLLRIFETLHIPNAVWSETVGQDRVSKDDILLLGNIQQHHLSQSEIIQFIQKNGLEELQDGECECLCLCQEIDVSVLLTDDMAVREKTFRLNLTPVGSLGIIVRAYRSGHISLDSAKHHIANLYDISSLFVTRTIVELAIEQLGL